MWLPTGSSLKTWHQIHQWSQSALWHIGVPEHDIHTFLSLQPCKLLSPHFLVHPNHTVAFFAFLQVSSSLSPLHLVLLQDFNCWPHALFSAFPFLLPGFLCVLSAILSLSCWSPLCSRVPQSLSQLLQGHHSWKQSFSSPGFLFIKCLLSVCFTCLNW